MVTAIEISEFLNHELEVHQIDDSSSNGLQMENRNEIKKIGFAVDACQESFEKAVSTGCQMLIVHHGIIWDGIKYIKGSVYRNVKYLIENNLALYGVHLPLDKHSKYGNNAEIARLVKLQDLGPFGFYNGTPIGCIGKTNESLDNIKKIMVNNGMKTVSLDFGPWQIKKVAISSGGSSKELFQAINAKADLYITGEPLHFTHHVAKENNINVIFGGHYETETWGVKALMPLLKEKFNVEVEFLDIPTLV
jgi:dinuclear metal center YbgI/SA1388 family protein